MEWYNEPKSWHGDEKALTVTTDGQTDYWRVTLHNFIADNAPFCYREVTGDFTATVKVSGSYRDLYDQAGLMVRENALVWMKCGIEYVEGVQYASAVITREFSDWSILPVPGNPASIWIRAKRTGAAIEVYYSLDGLEFTLIRQGTLSAAATLQVGMMCAAPKGDGFDVTFEGFEVA